jgi:hypothetical protein
MHTYGVFICGQITISSILISVIWMEIRLKTFPRNFLAKFQTWKFCEFVNFEILRLIYSNIYPIAVFHCSVDCTRYTHRVLIIFILPSFIDNMNLYKLLIRILYP